MNYYQPMGYQNNMYGYYTPNNYQPNVTNNVQNSLQGNVVDSVEVVKAMNCNLDGSPCYYPKADKTEIYCKQLNPQTGTGVILTYKLAENAINQDSNADLSAMISQLQNDMNEIKNLLLETTTMPQSSKGGVR